MSVLVFFCVYETDLPHRNYLGEEGIPWFILERIHVWSCGSVLGRITMVIRRRVRGASLPHFGKKVTQEKKEVMRDQGQDALKDLPPVIIHFKQDPCLGANISMHYALFFFLNRLSSQRTVPHFAEIS